jgi:hypothetical protein
MRLLPEFTFCAICGCLYKGARMEKEAARRHSGSLLVTPHSSLVTAV